MFSHRRRRIRVRSLPGFLLGLAFASVIVALVLAAFVAALGLVFCYDGGALAREYWYVLVALGAIAALVLILRNHD